MNTQPYASIAEDVVLGERVRLANFINLDGCEIGEDTRIGAFVEIQRQVIVGRKCKISSHTFICSGVLIEDEVFIGHGVIFINDRYPRATNADGSPQSEKDWRLERTIVRHGATIGSGAIIMCGVEVGEEAIVGAGAIVTHDVPARGIAVGSPARMKAKALAGRGSGQ
jgi:UDP-2-acetamido-3-amino-2,3-dideoxy-glucuronate N-acetyltransferase